MPDNARIIEWKIRSRRVGPRATFARKTYAWPVRGVEEKHALVRAFSLTAGTVTSRAFRCGQTLTVAGHSGIPRGESRPDSRGLAASTYAPSKIHRVSHAPVRRGRNLAPTLNPADRPFASYFATRPNVTDQLLRVLVAESTFNPPRPLSPSRTSTSTLTLRACRVARVIRPRRTASPTPANWVTRDRRRARSSRLS